MAQTPKEFSIVGKRTPRIDAYERVTGRAQYTGDLELPGMLYARVLRISTCHRLRDERPDQLAGMRCAWEARG